MSLAAALRGSRGSGARNSYFGDGDAESPTLGSLPPGESALPAPLRASLESAAAADLSGVRLHSGTAASAAARSVGARAFTLGRHVVLGQNASDLDGEHARRTLAHEVAHTLQQGGAEPTAKVGHVAPASAAEREASAFADAFVGGRPVTPPRVRTDVALARDDAAVHKDIEARAAGLAQAPDMAGKAPEPKPGTRERGMLEMYSGNFLQDFSQLNVPTVFKGASSVPRTLSGGDAKGEVGAMGGEALTRAAIDAVAILELGPMTASTLVAPKVASPEKSDGLYRPESHMDNPIGTSSADLLVRDAAKLRPARSPSAGADAAADAQLAGSAAPGRQVDEPSLYQIGPRGLANHIYNSVEWTKNHWLEAARLGPTPEGRHHLGAGLHIVEDYYSHSNFIEVALNDAIRGARAQVAAKKTPVLDEGFLRQVDMQAHAASGGPWVDTLFRASVSNPSTRDRKGRLRPATGERQAVTTGTFGPDDTRISIAHLLAPKLPLLRSGARLAIAEAVSLLDADPQVLADAAKRRTRLGKTHQGLALLRVLDGFDEAGVRVRVPIGISPLPTPSLVYSTGSITNAIELGAKLYVSLDSNLSHLPSSAAQALRTMLKSWLDKTLMTVLDEALTNLVAFLAHDPEKTKGRPAEEVVRDVSDNEEQLRGSTSIESRLKAGGDLAALSEEELRVLVGPVTRRGEHGWAALNPLPPSHSEISKDHPPTHGHGSPFHGLNAALALEADRHVLLQMERVWRARGSLFGDGKVYAPDGLAVSDEAVRSGAAARSREEAQLAAQRGFGFAQTVEKNRAALRASPETSALLALADLLIAHPADATWWRPVLEAYIREHRDEVLTDITERNRTREDRR